MKKNPLISITILSYNRPAFVQECILLLDGNLLKGAKNINYEIIIADDGSDEETRKIYETPLQNFTGKNGDNKIEKVFISDDRKRGIGYVLNEANKMAEGDYVLQVEDDFHLIRLFTEEQMFGVIEALETIQGMELCRLRNLDAGHNTRRHREDLDNTTEPKTYNFSGMEFRMYKKYDLTPGFPKDEQGPTYQYTGNAHLRRGDFWKRMGPFRENVPAGGVENGYAGKFIEKEFRSGAFMPGWFFHAGSGFSMTKIWGEEGR